MSKRRDNFHYHRKRDSNVPFRVFLYLVKCDIEKDEKSATYCNLPENKNDSRIWLTSVVTDEFYRHSSYKVALNCALWGEEGSFRVFLATNLTSSQVIGSSSLIKVVNNQNFGLDSFFTAVLPCHSGDIKPIAVSRPTCSPKDDRVRAYAQEHQIVGGNIVPTNQKYLGEVRIQSEENLAIFPCELLSQISEENVLEVCFRYITSSIAGTTYNPTSLCLPTTVRDARKSMPEWSAWNEWSSCSSSCGKEGTQFRHRFCQNSDKAQIRMLCKGQPVEYKSCDGPSCFVKVSTNLIKSSTFSPTEKPISSKIWKPLSNSESSSPCSCGCIFVVSRSRDLSFTSGLYCPILPISWKLNAQNGERLLTRIHVIEFSCSNSIFHLRDGGRVQDEIIYETESDIHSSSSLDSPIKNSSREMMAFQFLAPRRSCRINIRLSAQIISSQLAASENQYPDHPGNWWANFSNQLSVHLPLAVILLLAIVLVTMVSSICLAFKFEWERKKYVAWKSQPSSGYSTPNILDEAMTCNKIEDIHTSSEDIPMLVLKRKRKRGYQSGSRGHFRRAADAIRRHVAKSKQSVNTFHSLPPSPFLTRRISQDSVVISVSRKLVTAAQVKTAARVKSLRYKKGDFSKQRRSKVPNTSPTKYNFLKRQSRSLSDISSLLAFKLKEGILLNRDGCESIHIAEINVAPRIQQRDSDLRSVHFSSPDSSLSRPSRLKYLDSKTSKERLSQTRLTRLTVSSSNSTLGDKSLGGSNDTLKAAGSMSEFSQHSGDPELEFDLYDCDLNNASAVPGSFFAPTYSWDCDYDDVTPTGEEVEFELEDFFPGHSRNDLGITTNNQMNESRTSDLTASVTSSMNNDLTLGESHLDSSCYYTNDETDEEELRETDTLLRKSTLLNMTHIDEISFVDEESLALNV